MRIIKVLIDIAGAMGFFAIVPSIMVLILSKKLVGRKIFVELKEWIKGLCTHKPGNWKKLWSVLGTWLLLMFVTVGVGFVAFISSSVLIDAFLVKTTNTVMASRVHLITSILDKSKNYLLFVIGIIVIVLLVFSWIRRKRGLKLKNWDKWLGYGYIIVAIGWALAFYLRNIVKETVLIKNTHTASVALNWVCIDSYILIFYSVIIGMLISVIVPILIRLYRTKALSLKAVKRTLAVIFIFFGLLAAIYFGLLKLYGTGSWAFLLSYIGNYVKSLGIPWF